MVRREDDEFTVIRHLCSIYSVCSVQRSVVCRRRKGRRREPHNRFPCQQTTETHWGPVRHQLKCRLQDHRATTATTRRPTRVPALWRPAAVPPSELAVRAASAAPRTPRCCRRGRATRCGVRGASDHGTTVPGAP